MNDRILICGGRDYTDYNVFVTALEAFKPRALIHGGATGADALAARYAADHPGLAITCVPADWKRDGVSAGPIRNQRMLDEHTPDMVLAFPGGKGTADMVRRARRAGVTVVVVDGADQFVRADDREPVTS